MSFLKNGLINLNSGWKALKKLFYKRVVYQMLGCVFFGIIGFWAEIGLSVMLNGILVVIGLVSVDKLPDFIRNFNLTNEKIILMACLFILMRAITQFWRYLVAGLIFFDFKRIHEQKLIAAAITDTTHAPLSGAYVSSTIANIIPRSGSAIRSLADVLLNLVMVIPLTWFLIFLNVNLTVLSFVGFGLIAFASIRFNRYIMDLGSHVNPIFGSFTETYLRSIRNRILLRIYGTTDDEVRECMRLSQDFRNKSALSIKWQASVSVLNNLIAPVWLLIILWAGVSYLSISTGMLLSFFYIFIRLASYLSSLASSFSAMVADIPAIQELTAAPWVIQEITRFHKPAECSKNRLVYNQKIYEGAVYLEKAEMKLEPVIIEARQLAVDYNGKVVFQDLNFSLSRGNCLGIIGPSGSGKSTFIAVITGLMLPAKGEVLIDNVYPGHDHFFKFRRHIGYVGPEPLLKQGTVYENLIYGLNESVDMDKIFKVLEDVQLQEISKLGKDGLEHRIYEGGEGLSSGQKQRLCLARALLREPRLLILDEATANLDESTESSIIEYLRHLKGRMTMIISSHRPQPLTLADMVIDLGNANQPIN